MIAAWLACGKHKAIRMHNDSGSSLHTDCHRTKVRVNQHLPVHHARWIVCGHGTFLSLYLGTVGNHPWLPMGLNILMYLPTYLSMLPSSEKGCFV